MRKASLWPGLLVAFADLSGVTAGADESAVAPERPAVSSFDVPGFEARLGAFLHGVGGAEKGTYDLNPELIFPKLPFAGDRWWRLLIPRPHLGGLINLEGRTSSGYAGALWTVPFRQRLFGELFFDGALHSGYTNAAPMGRSDLGCAFLFHVGGSFGYRLSEHWSWMVTVDHESNGHSVFGIACEGLGAQTHNQGFNDYGTRFGYSF